MISTSLITMTASLSSMRVICVIAAVGLSAFPLLLAISSYNGAAAQSQGFVQDVLITINKGDYVLGHYGVIISNDMTGEKKPEVHTDNPDSPPMIRLSNNIEAFDGDPLIACAMIMDTEEIACDSQYADRFTSPLEFYIDMNTAQRAYGGGVDQFQP
jgi:hypothetical protein